MVFFIILSFTNVRLQFLIDLLFIGRAAHDADVKVLGASAYAEASCFALHALADADRHVQFFQDPLFPESPQCSNKIGIAGAAGVHFTDCVGDFEDLLLSGKVLADLFAGIAIVSAEIDDL